MSKFVYKYKFADGEDTMMVNALKVVLVAQQDEDDLYPTVWMEHSSTEAKDTEEEFELVVFGTGHPITDKHEHVGSAVCGSFVWHVYRLETPNVERP